MWSQERAAAEIQIDRKTYIRWENGQHIPQPRTLELACHAFGMSAQELGFIDDSLDASNNQEVTIIGEVIVSSSDSFEEGSKDWATWLGIKLAQIVTMIDMWHGQAAFCEEIQVMVDQEIKMIDHELQQHRVEEQQTIPRRQALITIAALPTTLAWGAGLATNAAIEEFLPRCAASITSCWHLMKGRGFVAVVDILSTFVPLLATVALRPSKYQQAAARLAVQACIIQGILAMHQLNFTKREAHCQDAVKYATISQDKRLQAVSLMYLGYTYSHCYFPPQPQKAIPIFHKALQALGEEPSLLRSDILMGLAEAYAQCKEEQEALRCLGLTEEHFPAYPELDPSFIYADCGLNTLYQWEGKTYLQLVEHFPHAGYQRSAADSLMKSIGVDSISARSANETVIYQADAARVLGELEIYTDTLRKAVQMATTIGSRRRYQDAVRVYQQTPEKWMKELKMRALARDVFQQVPAKKG
jgi:transcriptional regulator with XRE-family HTH domain